ncbi:hypothetical protein ACKFKG_13260 [Phormidesmis sp. 146-35]
MALGDELFLRAGAVDVDAAVIGVGRARWSSLSPEDAASTEKAIQTMRTHCFDVLPIDEGIDKPIYDYFHTQDWGKWTDETVVRSQVNFKDVLPAQTSVLDLIKEFVNNDRLFFFLSHEHRIVGLVSVANLNSRQVKFYLFALLCELETRLGKLIRINLDETKILAKLDESAKQDYQNDQDRGFDNDPIQYLYLSSLIDLARTERLFEQIGYPSKKQFEKLNTLNELRHQIMHPVRSLVHNKESLDKLWDRMEKLQDVLFRLRQLQGIN